MEKKELEEVSIQMDELTNYYLGVAYFKDANGKWCSPFHFLSKSQTETLAWGENTLCDGKGHEVKEFYNKNYKGDGNYNGAYIVKYYSIKLPSDHALEMELNSYEHKL